MANPREGLCPACQGQSPGAVVSGSGQHNHHDDLGVVKGPARRTQIMDVEPRIGEPLHPSVISGVRVDDKQTAYLHGAFRPSYSCAWPLCIADVKKMMFELARIDVFSESGDYEWELRRAPAGKQLTIAAAWQRRYRPESVIYTSALPGGGVVYGGGVEPLSNTLGQADPAEWCCQMRSRLIGAGVGFFRRGRATGHFAIVRDLRCYQVAFSGGRSGCVLIVQDPPNIHGEPGATYQLEITGGGPGGITASSNGGLYGAGSLTITTVDFLGPE